MSNKTGTKKSQGYKNTFAFKSHLHSTVALKINKLPVEGLCSHCVDLITWRKQFAKYKPLTSPKTCLSCHKKSIKHAYHVLCQACAAEKHVCAKCQASEEILPSSNMSRQEALKLKAHETRVLASCNERQRRSYQRKLDRGDAEEIEAFEKMLEKKGEDDDDFDLDSDLDDEEEN